MQRLIAMIWLVAFGVWVSPFLISVALAGAGGGCTAEQRIELGQIGYSPEEINKICGDPGDARQQEQYSEPYQQYPDPRIYQQRQPRLGTVCVTAMGTCPMMQPLPVNSQCACYTVYGAIPGYVQ